MGPDALEPDTLVLIATVIVCAYIFSIILRHGDMPARFVWPWERRKLMRFVEWCKKP